MRGLCINGKRFGKRMVENEPSMLHLFCLPWHSFLGVEENGVIRNTFNLVAGYVCENGNYGPRG